MTPDFWKANLFLTDNGGNDTLKANVAELKSLLTAGGDGGSSRVKMYASPRLIAQMKAEAEADTEEKLKKAKSG
jgi:hypothetical protein